MRYDLVSWFIAAAAAAHAGPCLKQAAALYHQGLYDSALSVLETCGPEALKRRDSLALFQYSGMAEARLGRDAEAAEDFRALLSLDSLFQFPRNEDFAVLAAFARPRWRGKSRRRPARPGGRGRGRPLRQGAPGRFARSASPRRS